MVICSGINVTINSIDIILWIIRHSRFLYNGKNINCSIFLTHFLSSWSEEAHWVSCVNSQAQSNCPWTLCNYPWSSYQNQFVLGGPLTTWRRRHHRSPALHASVVSLLLTSFDVAGDAAGLWKHTSSPLQLMWSGDGAMDIWHTSAHQYPRGIFCIWLSAQISGKYYYKGSTSKEKLGVWH